MVLLALGVVSCAEDDVGGVCEKDSCIEADPIEWEADQVGKQLISWVAQQRSRNKVVFCKEEVEKKELTEDAIPLYKMGRCGEWRYETPGKA